MALFAILFVTLFALLPDLNFAFPSLADSPQRTVSETIQTKHRFDLPIQRRRTGGLWNRGVYSGSVGLGDFLDLCVVVPFYHRISVLTLVLEFIPSP
jgi:hypothetical protein